MADFTSRQNYITWRSPKGAVFSLKTTESGYKRKHIGEVKENPRTTSRSSTTTSTSADGSDTKFSSGVSRSRSTKIVGNSTDTFSDMGISGRDIPIEAMFVGETHDIEAKKFTDALCEIGKSKLTLAFGDEITVNVLDFERKNNLVKNINSTVVTVNFHETSNTTYPSGASSGAKQIKSAAVKTNSIVAKNIADTVDVIKNNKKPSRLSKFVSSYSKTMTTVNDKLEAANDLSVKSILADALGQDVTKSASTITSQMQIAMFKSANLAFKIKTLDSSFALPGSVNSGLSSWRSLLSAFSLNSTPVSDSSSLADSDIDNLIINDAAAVSALAALSQAATEAEYITRKEAVNAASTLIELEDAWTSHVDEQSSKITDLGSALIRDTGISELVANAANQILENSYNLKVEKTVILSEDKPIINFAYENYPDEFADNPEEAINYLISSNNLQEDSFFLLSKGSEIKIYV